MLSSGSKRWTYWSQFSKEMAERLGHLSYEQWLREPGLFSLEEKGSWKSYQSVYTLDHKGGDVKETEPQLSLFASNRSNGYKLKVRKFHLSIRNPFSCCEAGQTLELCLNISSLWRH